MGSIRVRLVGDNVEIWRTEMTGKGKERRIKGTEAFIRKGEKFPKNLPAFMSKAMREQEKGE